MTPTRRSPSKKFGSASGGVGALCGDPAAGGFAPATEAAPGAVGGVPGVAAGAAAGLCASAETASMTPAKAGARAAIGCILMDWPRSVRYLPDSGGKCRPVEESPPPGPAPLDRMAARTRLPCALQSAGKDRDEQSWRIGCSGFSLRHVPLAMTGCQAASSGPLAGATAPPARHTAYLAAEGYVAELAHELGSVERVHGRLLIAAGPPRPAAWAANVWLNPQILPIASIAEAAARLRAIQRNWAVYAPLWHRRASLIQARLPSVSAKPLLFGAPPPSAPLGSWTLLDPGTVLAASHCSSPFPHGEAKFVEDRRGPPSRAYLKLWEALTVIGQRPARGRVSRRQRLCGRSGATRAGRLAVRGCRVLPGAAAGAGRALACRRRLSAVSLHPQIPGADRPRHRPPLCRDPRRAASPPAPHPARADLDQARLSGVPAVNSGSLAPAGLRAVNPGCGSIARRPSAICRPCWPTHR